MPNAPVQRRAAQRTVRCNRLLGAALHEPTARSRERITLLPPANALSHILETLPDPAAEPVER